MTTSSSSLLLPSLLPYCLGVLWGYYCTVPPSLVHITSLALVAVLFCSQFSRVRFCRSLAPFILTFSFFVLGGFQSLKDISDNMDLCTHNANLKCNHTGIIESIGSTRNGYTKLSISQLAHFLNGESIPCSSKALIFCDSSASLHEIGDAISFRATLEFPDTATIPGNFNYGKHLANQGFGLTGWADNLHQMGTLQLHLIPNLIPKMLSRTIQNTLYHGSLSTRSTGLLSALLFGNKSEITPDLMERFQTSGAMHMLAVSGLHVGIVLLLIRGMLLPFGRLAQNKPVGIFVQLIAVWSFALIAGASPSVIRAAVMFSCLVLGQLSRLGQGAWQNLALSAWVLLIFSPRLLLNPGFQLSYSAVAGILLIQPLLAHVKFKYTWIKMFFDITFVSIGAQAGTVALVGFYFHSLPTYSILTNLFVIPAAFIAVGAGILYLVLSPIHILEISLAYIINTTTLILDKVLLQISSLPSPILSLPHLPLLTWFAVGLGICAILLFVRTRSHMFICVAAGAICIYFGSFHVFKKPPKTTFIVSTPTFTALGTVNRNTFNVWLQDSAVLPEPLSNYAWFRSAKHIHKAQLPAPIAQIYFHESDTPQLWLVSTGKPTNLPKYYPDKLVLAHSLKPWNRDGWIKWARTHQVEILNSKGSQFMRVACDSVDKSLDILTN